MKSARGPTVKHSLSLAWGGKKTVVVQFEKSFFDGRDFLGAGAQSVFLPINGVSSCVVRICCLFFSCEQRHKKAMAIITIAAISQAISIPDGFFTVCLLGASKLYHYQKNPRSHVQSLGTRRILFPVEGLRFDKRYGGE